MDSQKPDEAVVSDETSEKLQLQQKMNKKKQWLFPLAIIVSCILVVIITLFWKKQTIVLDDSHRTEINNLIRYDKGLQTAVEHDFIQVINESDEHEGIKITVDSVIIDEAKMIVFYTMEGVKDFKEIHSYSVELLKSDGEPYGASSSNVTQTNNDQQSNSLSDRVDFYFNDENMLEKMVLNLKLVAGENLSELTELESTWSIPIQVDKKMFKNKKREYSINETVQIEGQSLTFHDFIIYPTRSELNVTYDENNTDKIFGLEDLQITDNEGNVWETVSNGLTGSHISETEHLLYLQSNYFDDPEEMYIEFSSIRAYDKNELDFQVDLSQNKSGKTSNDNIVLSTNRGNDEIIGLIFTVTRDDSLALNRSIYTDIEQEFVDAGGKEYRVEYTGYSPNDENTEGLFVDIPNLEYTYPLTFTLTDFPSTIGGEVRVKIK